MDMKVFTLLAALVGLALSFPDFQLEIPNGASVPNPCGTDTWLGVGHLSIYGSGPLNPFGEAFRAAAFKWTEALCKADSDSDGISNGAELGDKDCTWKKGATPAAAASGHPGVTLSFPEFQKEIPNGDSVPNPCADDIWNGVGHQSIYGSGPLTDFGKAFKTEGFKWTKSLCKADSDGDGISNGAELGDKDCTWKKGGTPAAAASGHPGVCEPTGSDRCRNNQWIYCQD